MSRWLSLLVVALLLCGAVGDLGMSPANACPMCKAALEEDDMKPMAYQTSILFMLSMPMAIFGTIGLVLVRVNRNETLALQATALLAEG